MENIYFDPRQGINSIQVCRGYRDQAGRPEVVVESRKILILYLNKQKAVSRKQNNIDADTLEGQCSAGSKDRFFLFLSDNP